MRSLSGSRPVALSVQSVAHTEQVQPRCWGCMYMPRLDSKVTYQSASASAKGRAANRTVTFVPVVDGVAPIGFRDGLALQLDLVDLVGPRLVAGVVHGDLHALANGEVGHQNSPVSRLMKVMSTASSAVSRSAMALLISTSSAGVIRYGSAWRSAVASQSRSWPMISLVSVKARKWAPISWFTSLAVAGLAPAIGPPQP